MQATEFFESLEDEVDLQLREDGSLRQLSQKQYRLFKDNFNS